MSTPARGRDPLPLPLQHDNTLLLLGQLLEATKAASDGLTTLGEEVRNNSVAVITASTTLQMLEQIVKDLNAVVRLGNGRASLVNRVDGLAAELINTGQRLDELEEQCQQHERKLGQLSQARHQVTGVGRALLWIVAGLFQLATLAIALYGVLK